MSRHVPSDERTFRGQSGKCREMLLGWSRVQSCAELGLNAEQS